MSGVAGVHGSAFRPVCHSFPGARVRLCVVVCDWRGCVCPAWLCVSGGVVCVCRGSVCPAWLCVTGVVVCVRSGCVCV